MTLPLPRILDKEKTIADLCFQHCLSQVRVVKVAIVRGSGACSTALSLTSFFA
jgi:hypothetical protein